MCSSVSLSLLFILSSVFFFFLSVTVLVNSVDFFLYFLVPC